MAFICSRSRYSRWFWLTCSCTCSWIFERSSRTSSSLDNSRIRISRRLRTLGVAISSWRKSVGGRRVFNPRIQLGDHAQQLLFTLQGTYKRQRALPPHRQRQHGARKEHRVADRQDWQNLRYRKFFLSHVFPSLPGWLPRAPCA